MAEKVCENCHRIVEGKVCPVCNESSFSRDWSGYVLILDPEKSEIAKRLEVDAPGRYALRVR
ncbi:MAG: DNA-directed RNA polymerase, subunit E'' [Hadesarchaea archaeon]|nr:DNA-directed RNA polymerase, subunit E'' [Hadesarchaea archaeon]